ncbi:Ig-like domain-containing protein [Enterobacteriaceae bacterium LUAb1]
MTLSASSTQLTWINPVTQGDADKPLSEKLKLTDSGNNLLSDVPISYAIDTDKVVFQDTQKNTASGTTSAFGQVGFTVISLVNEDIQFTINAWVTGQNSIKAPPLSVKFVSLIAVDSVVLTPKNSQADVDTAVAFTATVVGTNHSPKAGEMVLFSADPGVTLNPASAVTDKNGIATTQATGHQAGSITVTATAEGKKDTATVDFSYPVASVVMTPKNVQANVGTAVAFTATVVGTNHSPKAGEMVLFSADPGVTLNPASAVTDKNGIATTQATGHQAGSITVTATAEGKKDTATVDFSYPVASVVMSPKNVQAAANSPVTLTASIKGSDGKPQQGVDVSFIGNNGAVLSPPVVKANSEGYASSQVTNSHAGITTVTATAGGKSDTATVDFEFHNGYGAAAIITKDEDCCNIFAGKTFTFKIDSGFPTTGFTNATFTLAITGKPEENSLFDWSVNDNSAIEVDKAGNVTLKNPISEGIITARRSGWVDFTFRFHLKKWFFYYGDGFLSNVNKVVSPYRLPLQKEVSSGNTAGDGYLGKPSRGMGTLLGEWGGMDFYDGWSTSGSSAWTSDPAPPGQGLTVSLSTGSIFPEYDCEPGMIIGVWESATQPFPAPK